MAVVLLSLTHFAFAQSPTLFLSTGHSGPVNSIDYSADGDLLASGSADNTIIIRDGKSGELLRRLIYHQADVFAVAFSPDGKLLASTGYDRDIVIWNISTGEVQQVFAGHSQPVEDVVFFPDNRRIASCGRDSTIRIWDIQAGTVRRTILAHAGRINSMDIRADGQFIATGGSDKFIKIWRTNTGELVRSWDKMDTAVTCVAFSPDGKRLTCADANGSIRTWEWATERLIFRDELGNAVQSVGYDPEGRSFATADASGNIRVYDTQSNHLKFGLRAGSSGLRDVAFSSDGDLLAVGDNTGATAVIDISRQKISQTFQARPGGILDVAVHPDGKTFVTANQDGLVRIWDLNSGNQLGVIKAHAANVWSAKFDTRGQYLVTASEDGSAKVWDFEHRSLISTVRSQEGPIYYAVFSPDGRSFVTAGQDKNIDIWTTGSGRLLNRLTGHTARIWMVEFSRDGTLLATASDDLTARIWNSRTGQLIHTLRGHTGLVRAAVFEPEARKLATAASDNNIIIWEVKTGAQLRMLSAHRSSVRALRFSRDGRLLASGGFDNVVRLWDPANGRHLGQLKGHANDIEALTFTVDGNALLSCGPDGFVKKWDLQTQTCRLNFVHLPGRAWLAFLPKHLEFVGSDNVENNLAVRFGEELHEVAPISEYPDELKITDLRSAGQFVGSETPREAPSSNGFPWMLLAGMAGFIGFTTVGVRLHRRSRPTADSNLLQFFSQAGYRNIKAISNDFLVLHHTGQTPSYALNLRNGILHHAGGTSLGKSLRRSKNPKLYVIHHELTPPTAEINTLRAELNCRPMPVSNVLMNDSIAKSSCKELLDEIEKCYINPADPYLPQVSNWNPGQFFGRREQLDRLSFLLRQHRSVALMGIAGSGRTALAHQLRLKNEDMPSAFIDCLKMNSQKASCYLEIIKQLQSKVAAKCHHQVDALSALSLHGFQKAAIDLFRVWQAAGHTVPFLLILEGLEDILRSADPAVLEKKDVCQSLLQTIHALNTLHNCFSFVTTESRTEGAENMSQLKDLEVECVSFLTLDENRELLESLGMWAGISWEADATAQVFHYCGGHPLLTRRFASLVCRKGSIREIETVRVDETFAEVVSGLATNGFGHYFESEFVSALTDREKRMLNYISRQTAGAVNDTEFPDEYSATLDRLIALGLVASDLGRLSVNPGLFSVWMTKQ